MSKFDVNAEAEWLDALITREPPPDEWRVLTFRGRRVHTDDLGDGMSVYLACNMHCMAGSVDFKACDGRTHWESQWRATVAKLRAIVEAAATMPAGLRPVLVERSL